MPPAVDELIVSTLAYPCKKHSDNPTSFSSNKAEFFFAGGKTHLINPQTVSLSHFVYLHGVSKFRFAKSTLDTL